MTRHATVLLAVLISGLAGPARALVIDDFTAGGFTFQAGAGGATATQACGSFCLGGTREVFLLSGNASLDAFVQLALPIPEVANVMPDGGGSLSFSYETGLATPVDLTQGVAGSQLRVRFNAFAGGAAVRLILEDNVGGSQTVSQTPSLPVLPGDVDFALSSFAAVDLTHVTRVEVRIDAFGVGDYHVTQISVPSPDFNGSNFTLTNPTISGGPYPTEAIMIQACRLLPSGACAATLDVELSVVDVTNGGGLHPSQVMATLLPSSEGDRVSFGSEFMGVEPVPFRVQYRLAYQPPDPGQPAPEDGMPVLNWSPGQNYFEVKVDVMVGGGVQTLMLHGETDLGQTINFAGVTAVKGASTLITVDVGGTGDDPKLLMTLGGSFAPTAGVPTLRPWMMLLLAALLLAVPIGLLQTRAARALRAGAR